jgi:hypothetical protein
VLRRDNPARTYSEGESCRLGMFRYGTAEQPHEIGDEGRRGGRATTRRVQASPLWPSYQHPRKVRHRGLRLDSSARFLPAPAWPRSPRYPRGLRVPSADKSAIRMTRQQRVFATFQSGGLGSGGSRRRFHLIVTIQSDIWAKTRPISNVASGRSARGEGAVIQ